MEVGTLVRWYSLAKPCGWHVGKIQAVNNGRATVTIQAVQHMKTEVQRRPLRVKLEELEEVKQ